MRMRAAKNEKEVQLTGENRVKRLAEIILHSTHDEEARVALGLLLGDVLPRIWVSFLAFLGDLVFTSSSSSSRVSLSLAKFASSKAAVRLAMM